MVRMLIEAGAEVSFKQSGLVTPLHLAAKGLYSLQTTASFQWLWSHDESDAGIFVGLEIAIRFAMRSALQALNIPPGSNRVINVPVFSHMPSLLHVLT